MSFLLVILTGYELCRRQIRRSSRNAKQSGLRSLEHDGFSATAEGGLKIRERRVSPTDLFDKLEFVKLTNDY